jgi:hypothetical protein
MAILAEHARTWGTPEDVVARHVEEMSRVILRVRD